MEEAPENGKESKHSVRANGLNWIEEKSMCYSGNMKQLLYFRFISKTGFNKFHVTKNIEYFA